MRTTVICFLVSLLIVAAGSPARTADEQAVEGLEVLRKGFTGLNDFTADIVQEKELSLMNEKLVARGVVRFKRPGIFYMELYSPFASRMLLKDNLFSYKLVNEGVEEKIALPPEENLNKWLALLDKPVTEIPQGVEVNAERQSGGWTIHVRPKSGRGVKSLHVGFTNAGVIRRLVVEETNKDRTVIHFENVRRNVGLGEKDFTLK